MRAAFSKYRYVDKPNYYPGKNLLLLFRDNHCLFGGADRDIAHHDVYVRAVQHLFPADKHDCVAARLFVGAMRLGGHCLRRQCVRRVGWQSDMVFGMADEPCGGVDRESAVEHNPCFHKRVDGGDLLYVMGGSLGSYKEISTFFIKYLCTW